MGLFRYHEVTLGIHTWRENPAAFMPAGITKKQSDLLNYLAFLHF